jgi:hypothetical protein
VLVPVLQLRPRARSLALPSAAMEGIRALTAEAAAATDAFHYAACVADRTRLARCLFHAFDASSISLHSSGNAVLLRAVQQSGLEAAQGSAAPEVDGGDLLSLINLLHWCGEAVWASVDHSDSNPLWEVTGTLLLALATALYPRAERFDPADGVRGNFHPLLVRATQLAVAQHVSRSQICRPGAFLRLPPDLCVSFSPLTGCYCCNDFYWRRKRRIGRPPLGCCRSAPNCWDAPTCRVALRRVAIIRAPPHGSLAFCRISWRAKRYCPGP